MISLVKGANSNTWVTQVTPHPSVNSRFKRFLDILGSMVGLVILVIVFLPIAIAIKMDSRGPIFLYRKGMVFTETHFVFVNFVQWFRMRNN